MPWKGSTEGDVRQNANAGPVTGGFTHINANAPTAQATSVATDLGNLTVTHAFDTTDSKTTASKGKKRASTAAPTTNAKRTKTAEGKENTAKAKAKPAARKTTKQSVPKQTVTQSAKVATKKSKHAKVSAQATVEAPNLINHAPAASVKTVQQVMALTSMDVLSTAGHGAVLYTPQQSSFNAFHGASLPTRITRQSDATGLTAIEAPIVLVEDDFDSMADMAAEQFDLTDEDFAAMAITDPLPTLPAAAQPDVSTSAITTRSRSAVKAKKREAEIILTADEEFIGSDDSHTIAPGTPPDSTAPEPRSPTPERRSRKLNIKEVEHDEDYGGALLTPAERKTLQELETAKQNAVKTIVRKPFPVPVLDRSPIFGASNNAVLRTCFRVGEALNVGCQAAREGRYVLIELYARVVRSWREEAPSRRQHFILHDLYHDNPPHINGTFDLWGQSTLWDADSKTFLDVTGVPGAGVDCRVCRLVGRIKHGGTKWLLEILNVWEAEWEDVVHVAQIYAKPGDEVWLDYVD